MNESINIWSGVVYSVNNPRALMNKCKSVSTIFKQHKNIFYPLLYWTHHCFLSLRRLLFALWQCFQPSWIRDEWEWRYWNVIPTSINITHCSIVCIYIWLTFPRIHVALVTSLNCSIMHLCNTFTIELITKLVDAWRSWRSMLKTKVSYGMRQTHSLQGFPFNEWRSERDSASCQEIS